MTARTVPTPDGYRWVSTTAKSHWLSSLSRHLTFADGDPQPLCGATSPWAPWRGSLAKPACTACIGVYTDKRASM